jgi:hypothetical protein
MSTTSITVHYSEHEPAHAVLQLCVLNLDMRPNSGHESHDYDVMLLPLVMLPLSMLPRLTRAVAAFNAVESEPILDPTSLDEPAP